MEMAILDLADFESVGPGHGSRQKVDNAEAVSGSNHRDQRGGMVGNNAEWRLEPARKDCGQSLVANRLVGKWISNRDHRISRDLLERDGLQVQDGMPVRCQEHERLTPKRAHHKRPVGRLGTKRPDGDRCSSVRQSCFDSLHISVQHGHFNQWIGRPQLSDEAG